MRPGPRERVRSFEWNRLLSLTITPHSVVEIRIIPTWRWKPCHPAACRVPIGIWRSDWATVGSSVTTTIVVSIVRVEISIVGVVDWSTSSITRTTLLVDWSVMSTAYRDGDVDHAGSEENGGEKSTHNCHNIFVFHMLTVLLYTKTR